MICPNCGTQISNEVSFCPNCGRRVDVGEKTERKIGEKNTDFKKMAEEAQAENIKLKKQIKTIAIVAIVLALAAVVFFMVKNMKSDKEEGSDDSISIENASVGDYIEFGAYEQDNDSSNGKEPIEWRVLDKKDNRVLVISKYALDCKKYNMQDKYITWEDCTLREWLNEEFFGEAFSSSEIERIPTVNISAEDNSEFGTEAGNDTEDKIFLLSVDEAEKYFESDKDRRCKPTDYAVMKEVTVENENGCCWWWLRSPGYEQDEAAGVPGFGYVHADGAYVHRLHAVRPAMWIELE